MSVTMSPAQASALPSDLRNSIYSSLLSSGGIRTIESTLTQLLQTSGFQASLRAYITELFRTGQATTANEAYSLAMNRIKVCMAEGAGAEKDGGRANGHVNGDGEETEVGDLRLPSEVVGEGTKVVRRELERVVEIKME
ncbi:hypothetical protein BU25DRAFT_444919 [Macroventuria anomochaeta]|uniref:Uncharacterized protein n=1 Tax=Macroventuria anomochaeta TaxID=301207 RepID=A0ACB6SH57_9PLEO|nr:uncharacterized protein BU25DRAFT_444919 [Macroventuria anomochaeta]KAF2632920.1 hypothetical protein BU25DRAFT_444919 [Macroventuria anomochaeta]